jgi:hypothetical protein
MAGIDRWELVGRLYEGEIEDRGIDTTYRQWVIECMVAALVIALCVISVITSTKLYP